jgi:SAM-dependent methyltransferase
MNAPPVAIIKRYYDERIDRKIWDFTSANPRIEAALEALIAWIPKNTANILEIGCGIGASSWRIARLCRQAKVLGVDISPRSIEVARTCFRSDNLSFRDTELRNGSVSEKFDFVVMMDVYEHIAVGQRPDLHAFIAGALTASGRIFLSVPTPQHLQFLRDRHPEEIQPVDEDIDVAVLQRLSEEIDGRLLFYREVSIWHTGDYAHAVIGRDRHMAELPAGQPPQQSIAARLGLAALLNTDARKVSKREREKIVRPWSNIDKS